MNQFVLGMAGDPNATGGNPLISMLIFFVPIVLIMYFFMIRPQQKRSKEHQRMLGALKNGDKVVTTSGMMGTVVGIHDEQNKVVLKVADQVKIEFVKSSIAGLVEN